MKKLKVKYPAGIYISPDNMGIDNKHVINITNKGPYMLIYNEIDGFLWKKIQLTTLKYLITSSKVDLIPIKKIEFYD